MNNFISTFAAIFIALSIFEYNFIEPLKNRVNHLESVTFESSRCPDNKTFSLVNLGR